MTVNYTTAPGGDFALANADVDLHMEVMGTRSEDEAPVSPYRRPDVDLSEVEVANFRAATLGPLHLLRVSWLRNGSNGTTLPEELIAKGHHISHRAYLPEWLEARVLKDGRLTTEAQFG